jgi:hypothetical protein
MATTKGVHGTPYDYASGRQFNFWRVLPASYVVGGAHPTSLTFLGTADNENLL